MQQIGICPVTETFDRLVETALSANQHFAYEGHFTNEAPWDIPCQFRAAGYSIHLIFLGLQDTGLSELRVVDRSQAGGHYVDPRTVADNFYGNLEKLNEHYEMFQTVQIIDASKTEHVVLVVSLVKGKVAEISDLFFYSINDS